MTETVEAAAGVRAARKADAPQIASILADAFTDDPVMSWMMGRPNPPETFFLELARGIYLRRGYGHLAEDSAATLWLPAGEAPHLPFANELRLALSLLRHIGASGIGRARACGEIIGANHPAAPHYYLFAVGVRNGMKGKGLGGRLIREGLRRADKDRAIAYLENSNPKNTPLYQRFGFEAQSELPLPKGAPPLLAMLRPAKEAA